MCGSKTRKTTQTQSTAPDPAAMAYYRDMLQRARDVGNLAYTPYEGQRVAEFTPYQQMAMQGIEGLQGAGAETLQQAVQAGLRGGAPITSADIQRYMDPYQSMLVDAMSAKMRQQEAEDISKLQGTSISSGAFGGDRARLAEAQLMRNQEQERNYRIADLMSKGYSSSLSAAQADREAAARAGVNLQSLAGAEFAQPLSQLQALYGAGAQQQALAQQQLNVPYQTYLEQRAFPYEQLQYLAGIGTGVGSQMGGTSQGVTTQPGPNTFSQIAGLGLSLGLAPFTGGMSLAAAPGIITSSKGGRVKKEEGGGLTKTAMFHEGFIPTLDVVRGAGAPRASAPSPSEQQDPLHDVVNKAMSLASKMKSGSDSTNPASWQTNTTFAPDNPAGWTASVSPFEAVSPMAPSMLFPTFAHGGGINIPHYDNGGGTYASLIDMMMQKTPDVIETSDALENYGKANFNNPTIIPSPLSTSDLSSIINKNLEEAPTETGETKAELPELKVEQKENKKSGISEGIEDGKSGGVSGKGSSFLGGLLGLSPEAEQAGMMAGLAMMAGESPFALTNIGAGGQAGMKYYNELMKAKQEQALKEKEIAGKAKKRTPTTTVTEDGDIIYLDEDGSPVYFDGKPIPPDKETMPLSYYKEMKKGQSAEKEQKQKARSSYRAFHQQTKQIEDQIDQVANALSPWSTGLAGRLLKDIPETEANQIKEYLENLKILIGLEKLQEFKQLSTTGASGFGTLTENEFLRLMNSQGSLSQNLPIDKLVTELNKVRNIVARMKYNYEIDYEERYGSENKPKLKDFSLSDEEFMKQAQSKFAPDEAPTMTATSTSSEETTKPVHPNYLGSDTVTQGGKTFQWDNSINDYVLKE